MIPPFSEPAILSWRNFELLPLGIFPSIFCCHYLVVKTQYSMSFKTQSFFSFLFNKSSFIVIIGVLFLIHYPLEKDFKEGCFFSVLDSESAFSSNLGGFKLQDLYSPFWVTIASLYMSLTKINNNPKTQFSKQKQW